MNPPDHNLEELRIDRTELNARSSRNWIWILLVAVIFGSIVIGPRVLRGGAILVRTEAARDAGSGDGRVVLNASGYVVPRREATISSKVTGKVVEVLIEEGMKVEENQVLARLDDSNVKAGLRVAEAELEAAKAARAETLARLDEAERQLHRVNALTSEKVASASDLDRAEVDVNSLKARCALQLIQVSVAERQVSLWQQQLNDTIIRAPFNGIAVSKNAQPGEMISPVSAGGGFTRTGIGTVVDMSSLEIEVDVNESFINRVQPGQPVEATLDAYPDWKIPSKVLAIIPTADRQKSTVKVRVKFDQLDPRILPQMGVKVAFRGTPEGAAPSGAVIVPKAALRQDGGQDVVFVVREGRAERRLVTTNRVRDQEATLTAGVTPGERVVVEGPTPLKDGARVRERKP